MRLCGLLVLRNIVTSRYSIAALAVARA